MRDRNKSRLTHDVTTTRVHDWDMHQTFNKVDIAEVRFVREGDKGDWTFVIQAAV